MSIPSLPTAFTDRADDSGVDPVVVVEIGGNTNWYFSTEQLTAAQDGTSLTASDYDPILEDVGEIIYRLRDGLYGTAITGDFTFSINNVNQKSDNIQTAFGAMENETVIVRQGFMTKTDGSAYTLDDFVLRLEWIIREYEVTEDEIVVTIYDPGEKRSKQLPSSYITTADYPNAHPDALGKPIPITYGEWDYALGYQTDDTLGAQVVKFDTEPVADKSVSLYAWDDDYKRFVDVSDTEDDDTGSGEWSRTSSSAIVTFDAATNPFAETGRVLLRRTYYIRNSSDQRGSANITDEDNFADNSGSTYTLFDISDVTTSTINTGNKDAYVPLVFSSPAFSAYAHAIYPITVDATLGDLIHLYPVMEVTNFSTYTFTANSSTGEEVVAWIQANPDDPKAWVGGGTTGYEEERYNFTGDFNNITGTDNVADVDFVYMFRDLEHSGGESDVEVRWKNRNGLASMVNSRLIIGGYFADSDATSDFSFRAYRVSLLAFMTIYFDETPKVFAEMDGRKFNGTWNGRKTSGNAVKEAQDVLEGIFRHELGLADADIDDGSFDAVDTDLGTFNFAWQLLEKKTSADVINNLCEQMAARQYKRYDGREALKVFDSSDSSAKSFTASNILKRGERSTFRIKRDSLDKIYNEYFVRYNKNQETGEFEDVAFATASDDNMATAGAATRTNCSNSQTKYSHVNRLTIEADAIRDQTTADALINRICNTEKSYAAHYVVEFETTLADGLELELTDTITVTYDWLPSSISGGKFEIIAKSDIPDEARVKITARSHGTDSFTPT